MERRGFLGAAAGAGLLGVPSLRAVEEKPGGASKIVKGKDDRLLIQTKYPAVLETPVSLLVGHNLTPLDVLFVRNNQQLKDSATLEPLPLSGWKIELAGLIGKPVVLDAAELAKLPVVEREMVLQCSGNARSKFSKAAKVSGTPWGKGGVGNVNFTGVPLSEVLKKYGVSPTKEARFVTAEGRDPAVAQGKPDFEHSLPLDEVLRKSILAFKLNGKPLPAVHGGPVRLVTPGFYGSMHLKWLSKLRFEKDETKNAFQMPNYRTPLKRIKPGTKFEATFENSRPSYRMKLVSFIFTPDEGGTVPAGKVVEVRGVAFNDGERGLERVEVSCDKGRTWTTAELKKAASPYAWSWWGLRTTFGPGRFEVWSRATDSKGYAQPLDGTIDWNPHGYEWNGVDKVAITAG
jgi:DMSO/TMAO reductase YedYZ molybdopterin-dependent catalytic subunit